MRYILSLLLLPFLLTLSAQDTLLITQVDTKPQLKTEGIPAADGETDQENLSLQLRGQVLTYPPDSLTTLPAIPRNAVKMPAGRPTGPDARLAHAIYNNVRFPRTALINRVGGKVLVYGTVDSTGIFQIDSAGLFQEQSMVVVGDGPTVVKTQDILLGHVKEFILKKKKWLAADAPKKWSKAQKDLVVEALRVARELPRFKPGTIRGRNVATYVNIPVVFRHGLDRF